MGKEKAYGRMQVVDRHFHLKDGTKVNKKQKKDAFSILDTRQLNSYDRRSQIRLPQYMLWESVEFCKSTYKTNYEIN